MPMLQVKYPLFEVADISSAFIGVCLSPQCIVLEYVGGGSIEKRIKKMPLSPQEILKMCRDTAAGMAHLVSTFQYYDMGVIQLHFNISILLLSLT
jgi:serine/threonine protein kinase